MCDKVLEFKIKVFTFAAKLIETLNYIAMYWTLELASKLEDAPWPATKEELIDYATRSGCASGGSGEFAGDRR